MDKIEEIRILEYKKMSLEGATVIDGIPSSGLGSAILANYLVGHLNLDQIAAVDSLSFPPLSMVYDGKPKYPARVYADEKKKIAVFMAEFRPLLTLDRPLASAILSWARSQKCSRIISTSQVLLEEDSDESYNLTIYGVGCTERARQHLQRGGISQMQNGIIAGIPGILLNEGRWTNFDVCVVVITVIHGTTNTKVAARLTEAVGKLTPETPIDVKPLQEQAEKIENRLKTLRKQAQTVELPQTPRLYA